MSHGKKIKYEWRHDKMSHQSITGGTKMIVSKLFRLSLTFAEAEFFVAWWQQNPFQ